MLSLSGRLGVNLDNYFLVSSAALAAEEASDVWVAPRGYATFESIAQFAERVAYNAQQEAELSEAKSACHFMNIWAKRLGVQSVKVSEFRALNKRSIVEAKMDLRRQASQLAIVVSRKLRGEIPNKDVRLAVAKMAAVSLNDILYKGVVISDVHVHIINKYPAAKAADALAAAKAVMMALEARHKHL